LHEFAVLNNAITTMSDGIFEINFFMKFCFLSKLM
jgi:hypothetical protein